MTAQESVQFHICTSYDAAVWVRHSVLTRKPASFPGYCLNEKNLSVCIRNFVFITAVSTESFTFSGMIVLFPCRNFPGRWVGRVILHIQVPEFNFVEKKMLVMTIQTAKSLILKCIRCHCVHIYVALQEVNTWILANANSDICRHSGFLFLSAVYHCYQTITP